jgi:hypothetical protein
VRGLKQGFLGGFRRFVLHAFLFNKSTDYNDEGNIFKTIAPVPVLSQLSFTPKVRHINLIWLSCKGLLPVSPLLRAKETEGE